MKKTTMSGFAVAVAALVVAGSAGAQVCAGFPIAEGQGSIGGLASFPSGVNNFGVEGAYNFTGPFSANAGYIRSTETGGGPGKQDVFRVGAALDISSAASGILPGVSVCPNARADFASQGGVNSYSIPVGLGLGVSLPLGAPDMSLSPYVIPAAYFTHISGDIGGVHVSDSSTDFGIRGGADLNVDRFYFGGTVEWINVSGNKAVFGVRAGIKL
ncbi:MAG TPA: hypothetical protein VGO40_07750 [Longimicrobium sp.]|jgi:hypothetical protein|nr:hypothetical protein [Longimicrobium sp.]